MGFALLVCFSDLKQLWTSFASSDQDVAKKNGNIRNVEGKTDQVRSLYMNESNSLGHYDMKSRYCKDAAGSFLVHNNRAVRMTCYDLRRLEYLFACTWSDVWKKVIAYDYFYVI